MSANSACLPGEPTHKGTSMVETATTAIQSFAPINTIHQHVCGIHFYGHDMTRQVEAHHYCAHQNEEMRQCLIYDSEEKDARLIGIEYIVSESLFMLLPDSEKPMWHSHEYEVKKGIMFMPSVPELIERQDMEKLAKTYGKLIYFWQVDRGDTLPLGLPQVMMAFTRDYQLYDDLQLDLEKRYHLSFTKEAQNRKDVKGCEHGVHPLANGAGKGLATVLREIEYCKPTDLIGNGVGFVILFSAPIGVEIQIPVRLEV